VVEFTTEDESCEKTDTANEKTIITAKIILHFCFISTPFRLNDQSI